MLPVVPEGRCDNVPGKLLLPAPMAKRVKGILFDLGDTLVDFGKVDVPSLFEAGAKLAHEYLSGLGYPVPSLAKYHRQQLWAIRWSYFKSRLTGREFNALDLLGRLSAKLGHELSDEQIVELAWRWYEPLRRCATVEPGLREMLRRFRRDGVKLGVVSNTFVPAEVLDRHLDGEGLLDLLPVRVYSCDVRYRKPHPSIFRIAQQRLTLAAGEIIFVGDSPYADIGGANAAGMISVLKDPAGRHAAGLAGAKHRIERLAELAGVVGRYNDDVQAAGSRPRAGR